MKNWWKLTTTAILSTGLAIFLSACTSHEHPTGAEHPQGQEHPKGKEHPEGKEQQQGLQQSSAQPVTKESLATAIENYVNQESRLKGGYFLVYDEQKGEPLVLTLKKVHKERLATLGNDTYFACADFETPAGKVYDLDVFMKGPNTESLKVTQITVHKEAGQPRYTWYEEDGIWKRQTVSQ